jgi:hypothetical protein
VTCPKGLDPQLAINELLAMLNARKQQGADHLL